MRSLKTVCDARVTMKEAFRVADGVLIQGVRGITDLILKPGTLNGDFADVEAVLRNGGEALIGTGAGRGDEAILDALRRPWPAPCWNGPSPAPPPKSSSPSWPTGTVWSLRGGDGHGLPAAATTTAGRHQGLPGGSARAWRTGCWSPCWPAASTRKSACWRSAATASTWAAPRMVPPQTYTSAVPIQSQPLPANVVSGRVYGEMPAGEQGPTPTRLLPQAPTPSGELPGAADDLHVPAIIRMGQGRLPIE